MNVIKEMSALFDGRENVRGEYKERPLNGSGKVKVSGAAKTVREKVTRQHWQDHLDGKVGLGLVPIRDDQCCVFGVIDIDEYDVDHAKLHAKVIAHYPFLLHCRSKSGGAHLYLLLSEPMKAVDVVFKLDKIAATLGHPGVEIFPKQRTIKPGDVGNWINLPMFNIAGPSARHAYKAGKGVAKIEDFIELAQDLRISASDFLQWPLAEGVVLFEDGPPCLQRHFNKGIDSGQRNTLLFNFGTYFRMKYGDEFTTHLSKLNNDLATPIDPAEFTGMCKSIKRKDFGYQCNEAALREVCDRDTCLKSREFGIQFYLGDSIQWPTLLGTLKIGRSLDVYGEDCGGKADAPVWIEVNGVEELMTYEELTDQKKLRKILAMKHGMFPANMKAGDWIELLQEKFENKMDVEIPFSETYAGSVMALLDEFCGLHGGADTREEVDMGKVWFWEEQGRHVFLQQPFLDFIVKRNFLSARDSRAEKNRLWDCMRKDLRMKKNSFILSDNVTKDCWQIDHAIIVRHVEQTVKLPQTEF
jgi:hypothetical protein